MLIMHSLCALHIHILGRHKIDIIKSNVHRNERNLVTLGLCKSLYWHRRFQNLRIPHAFARAIIFIRKLTFRSVFFLKFSSDKMTLCNINAQTWFSDTLTSA